MLTNIKAEDISTAQKMFSKPICDKLYHKNNAGDFSLLNKHILFE